MSNQKPDHTLLSTLDRCEQEAVYRYKQHLAPPAPDISALVGQIVHLGVQLLYEGKALDVAHAQMRERWGVGAFGALAAADSKRAHLNIETACKLVTGYANEWMSKTPSGVTPASSLMFTVLWNEGYAESDTESGIPDRAVRSLRDGKVYAMDLKTRGYVTAAWQRSFEHSMQAAMQIDILESVLGEPVAGFWLDAIQVGKGSVTSLNYSRYGPIEYSMALRQELRYQRYEKKMRWQALANGAAEPSKNLTSCMRFNALCPFFDICAADPAERESLVAIKVSKGELVEREWDPALR